jgi:hypothetical protein
MLRGMGKQAKQSGVHGMIGGVYEVTDSGPFEGFFKIAIGLV